MGTQFMLHKNMALSADRTASHPCVGSAQQKISLGATMHNMALWQQDMTAYLDHIECKGQMIQLYKWEDEPFAQA